MYDLEKRSIRSPSSICPYLGSVWGDMTALGLFT